MHKPMSAKCHERRINENLFVRLRAKSFDIAVRQRRSSPPWGDAHLLRVPRPSGRGLFWLETPELAC
jgi:hypothetical protein